LGAKARIIATLLTLVLCPVWGYAHDLGVRGKLFPIKEQSFLQMIVQRAAKTNWKAVDERLQKKAEWDVHHFPQQNLPKAQSTVTTYFSPGIILQKNISAPMETPNGYQWQVVYKKGTHVNPLREGMAPVTRMLFFNENSKSQVAFMEAAVKAYPYFILPVALGGNIPKLAKTIGRPMYYAYSTILQRFQILATPALLGVGRGPYRYDMAVTYFGPHEVNPAKAAAEIHAAWYGLTGKGQVKMLPRAPQTLHGRKSLWSVERPGGKILTGGSADIYADKSIAKYNAKHGTNIQP